MLRNLPLAGPMLADIYLWLAERRFQGSAPYWERRYLRGGNSGDGSYGELAAFKARVLNGLVDEYALQSVIEFGCGDGHQLTLLRYPNYLGLDVSAQAIAICRALFRDDPTKAFLLMQDYADQTADAALSLDVVFHLVEDEVFDRYMRTLFRAGTRMVIIYSTDTDRQEPQQPPHVRHRRFSRWVEECEPEWELIRVIDNEIPYEPVRGTGSPADFFVYQRKI